MSVLVIITLTALLAGSLSGLLAWTIGRDGYGHNPPPRRVADSETDRWLWYQRRPAT